MAVNNNYNVKVQLDPENFPADNKVVIWDPGSGSFALTGSYGAGGTTGVIIESQSIEKVNPATTLNFSGVHIHEYPTGTANITANLQTITNEGRLTTQSSWFLSSQSLNWGSQIGIRSDSGFRSQGADAYTHVTPRRSSGKQVILSMPAEGATADVPQAYPNNYITFTTLAITDGTSGTSGDTPTVCTNKFFNETQVEPLYINDVTDDDILSIADSIPGLSNLGLNINDEVIIYSMADQEAYIEATVSSYSSPEYFFTVTNVVIPAGFTAPSVGNGAGYCIYLNDSTHLSLVFSPPPFDPGSGTSQRGTSQLIITNNSSSTADPRSGILLSSVGNIYFFNNKASASQYGELLPASASAKISLSPDNSLKFSVKESTDSSSFQEILFISKSGNEPRVGIGFDYTEESKTTQFTSFEVKTSKDSTDGTEFLLRSSRTDRGANVGDSAGAIYFIIDSGSFGTGSKAEYIESASIASLTSEVTAISTEGAQGVFKINTARSNTEATRALWTMGYGADPRVGGQFGSITTGSLNIVRPANSIDDMLTLTGTNGEYMSLQYYSASFTTDNETIVNGFVTGSYNGALYDYTLINPNEGARTGQIMAIFIKGIVEITDISTPTIGPGGTPPIFTSEISGNPPQFVLKITSGSGYTFRSFVKKI
jgi:hypothetical protein